MLVLVAVVALSFVVPPATSTVLRLISVVPALAALAIVLAARRRPARG